MSRKLALIIGNSAYQDSRLAQLITPGKDARRFGQALLAPHIGAFNEVNSLINKRESDVRREIARFFAEKKKDDLLLLYFSGHGILDDQGLLYFAVQDTEYEILSATAIPASFIRQEMSRSNSRRQVLILDCCHSGAFGRGAKGALGASVGTAGAFEVKGYGHVVLTATDVTQYAWEGDHLTGQPENSVFTRHLIRGLRTGDADLDGNGLITLDELYDYIYEHVVKDTPRQTPCKFTEKQQGQIVIAHNPRGTLKPAARPKRRKGKRSRQEPRDETGRLRAEALLKEIKQHLAASNTPAAREVLGELQAGKFRSMLSKSELRQIQALQSLAVLASGEDCDIESIFAANKDSLPKETAGALIARSRNLLAPKRQVLIALKGFPQEKLPPALQNEFAQAIRALQKIEDRLPEWPPPLQPYLRLALLKTEKSELAKWLDGENPFGSEQAEDEESALFSERLGAFWDKHPAYSGFSSSFIPEIVYGPEGCGKTTLALAWRALNKLRQRNAKMPVYVAGQPTVEDLQRAIAREMLDFVSCQPFLLATVGQQERALLAQQFVTADGKKVALAHLEAARRNEARLAEAEDDKGKRARWAREDEIQFKLLENEIREAEVAPWTDEGRWLPLIEQCAHSLGLGHILVLLDATTGNREKWARSLLLRIRPWGAHSVIVKLFLPQNAGEKLAAMTNTAATRLTWSEAEIRDMAEWRFNRFMQLIRRNVVLAELFAEEAVYRQFILAAQGNPRRLIQVWNRMLAVHDPNRRTFTEDELKRAL